MLKLIGKAFGYFLGAGSSGTNPVVNKLLDTADEAFYTDQEAVQDTRQFTLNWLAATTPQAETRQTIALALTRCFLSCFMLGTVGKVIASGWVYLFVSNATKATLIQTAMVDSSTQILEAAESLGGYFLLILGFYFAIDKAPAAWDSIKAYRAKRTETKEKQ